MYRISLIISEIYNKYLPLAERGKIQLNLDIPDSSFATDDPESLKNDLEEHLRSALERTPGGQITVALRGKTISITDSGTTLSKPICALLSKGRVHVKSRVGFGTTVSIDLTSSNPDSQKSLE